MPSSINQYTLGKTLGQGFSAKVKEATDSNGKEFALKIFRLDNPNFNEKAFKLLKEEVEATTSLDNKHVVKYFEFQERAVWQKENSQVEVAYIAQEKIPGGELFDYVANSGPFSEAVCRYYFRQLLQGVHYIHSKGFSHRDLKPENILLDKNYDIKIVDFGFACPLEGRDGSGTNRSVIGTPGYMAPEILARQPYQGQVVDLFALGTILFILYSGHPPFSQAQDQDTYYKLLATNRSDLFWKAHENPQRQRENFYSAEFKDLITCMLQIHPHQRLCMADIIGHPWLQGETASAEAVREEFCRRDETNKQRARESEEKKLAQRNAVNNQATYRDFKLNNKVYLSMEEAITDDIKNMHQDIVRLQTKEYRGGANPKNAFFSLYKPDYLFDTLTKRLGEQGQNYKVSDKTWKITFDCERVVPVDDDENEQAAPQEKELCTVQVEISQVPGQEKYCVDFKRKAGSSLLFYDNANRIIDMMELCINTTYDANADSAIVNEQAAAQQ